MDKEIETLFDELATITNEMRQRDAKNRKAKKKAEALLAQVESIAKKKKNKITTKKHAISLSIVSPFKLWEGRSPPLVD